MQTITFDTLRHVQANGPKLRSLKIVAALAFMAGALGCGSTNTEEDPRLYGTDVYQMQEAQVMEYLIGPSDVLSISVWNRQDLSRKVTVRPDGRLSYSLIGDI